MEALYSFIQNASWDSLNEEVKKSLKEALVDIVGCMIAGSQTETAQIAYRYSAQQWAKGRSTVFMSSDRLQPMGASFVNACMANALDMDDGHRLTKGHPGAAVFPAVWAAAENEESSGKELLISLLIGYEVGIRAAILAHLLRPEYHCTGSWGALGAAAGVSKILDLSQKQVKHALGIAEYHAPYSPMMRCIEYPSMLKDAISWGSMTGISSAWLARDGFTGIPSLFHDSEAQSFAEEWGRVYRVEHLYYKPYACCRWAQPAVDAVRYIQDHHQLHYHQLDQITIYTFTESSKLSQEIPRNTEEAQYNLTFPVASYLLCGEVGPKQILEEIGNEDIHRLMKKIRVVVDPQLDEVFPEKALSRVEIKDHQGMTYTSPVMQAKGDYNYPLTSQEKEEKFFRLTTPILGEKKSKELLLRLHALEDRENLQGISELVRG